ncbi:hypothetical protein ACFFRR_007623 [Megaselia abdita]
MKIAVILLIVVVILAPAKATFDLPDIMDLSNVDLANFQYFKYPSKMYLYGAKAMVVDPITDHFARKKAVVTYFRNILFGNPDHNIPTKIVFDPDFGKKWAPYFEGHFGKRGERLIELLGKGYSPEKLRYYGAISKKKHY